MKTQITLSIASLVSFIITPAMAIASPDTTAATAAAAAKASVVATYECGTDRTEARKVQVLKQAANYSIAITYRAKNKSSGRTTLVNIVSKPISVDDARSMFDAGKKESFANDTLTKLTGLPAGSVAFAGFHYPSGEMYVTAEGDTNEEGYIFAADKALLLGERTADVADLFWSDFHKTQVTNESCSLVP